MSSRRGLGLLLAAGLILFSSCQPSPSPTLPPTSPPPPLTLTPTPTPPATPSPTATPARGQPPTVILYNIPDKVWGSATKVLAVQGTVRPGDKPVTAVKIALQNTKDKKFWDGQGWVDGETWLEASQGPSSSPRFIPWSYNINTAILTDGVSYIVQVISLDSEGQTSPMQSDGFTFYSRLLSSLSLKGLRVMTGVPGQVQFVFSLADQDAQLLTAPLDEIRQALRLYEDNVEIDYSQTALSLRMVESFEIEAALILDFTNNMFALGAVPTMVEGANGFIGQMSSSHRVAVVEYHDRNVEPAFLLDFSTDKEALKKAMDAFLTTKFDPGTTRAWDAVYAGLQNFSSSTRVVKALVLLSDGRDTSSTRTAPQIIELAKRKRVPIYVLGTGSSIDEATLRQVAEATSGTFYRAQDAATLKQQFQKFLEDLKAQYLVSYLTLKREGFHKVKLEVAYKGVTATAEQSLDLGSIKGDDRKGLLSVDRASIKDQKVDLFFRALHVPRNISRFRFKIGLDKPFELSIPSKKEGGLLEGWQLSGPDAQGYYELASERPLTFADFGLLFKLSIRNIPSKGLIIPFVLDNEIYSPAQTGKEFTYPSPVIIGVVLPTAKLNPLPNHRTRNSLPTFAGEAANPVPQGTVTQVEYRVDGGPWLPARAVDGSFNSAKEAFTITLSSPLIVGAHSIEVRARNQAGEWTEEANYTRYSFQVDPAWKVYNFEMGVVPNDVITDAYFGWRVQPGVTYEGNFSIRSGDISHGSASEMSLTLEIPEDVSTISFYYLVSSEVNGDFLRFAIDGRELSRWSGNLTRAWQRYEAPLTPGKHTFSWSYTKNSSGSAGSDVAWIDLIEFR